MRHPDDKPSIGLILCKSKNRLIAEYALRGTATPMGVAEFKLLEQLPEQLKGALPTVEEIEAELGQPLPDGPFAQTSLDNTAVAIGKYPPPRGIRL